MKGFEFLNFMSEMKGLTDTSLRDKLVDMFQLDTRGKIRKMSKGMKQKIGLYVHLCIILGSYLR